MATLTGSLTCPTCFEAYTAVADPPDRRPITFCKNGHTLCSTCANSFDKCPTCNESKVVVSNEADIDLECSKRKKLRLDDATATATGVGDLLGDQVEQAVELKTSASAASNAKQSENASLNSSLNSSNSVTRIATAPDTASVSETTTAATTATANAISTGLDTAAPSLPNVDVYSEFQTQLHALDQSVIAYKLTDARSQVEECRRLLGRLDGERPATVSTTLYHSLKGYVHHWFGERVDAYAETYQALTELYRQCLTGTRVEGEVVLKVLCYAVRVLTLHHSQNVEAGMLAVYAVHFAKSKMNTAAYADALETVCSCFDWVIRLDTALTKFVLSTRLEASAEKPGMGVVTAYYCHSNFLISELLYLCDDFAKPQKYLDKALDIIEEVDPDNIMAALCKNLKVHELLEEDEVLRESKALEEAILLGMDALRVAKRILGKNNPTVADIYRNLGLVSVKMQNYEDAERFFKKAIKSAESSLGPNSVRLADILKLLAKVYYKRVEKYKQAEKLFLRVIEIQKGEWGCCDQLRDNYFELMATCRKWKKPKKFKTYSLLSEEIVRGYKVEDKYAANKDKLDKLFDEVPEVFECSTETTEAPEELVDALRKFFIIAPQPQPQTQTQPV